MTTAENQSLCNYCKLNDLKAIAQAKEYLITVCGQATYMHPPGIKIKTLRYRQREKYFVAWFCELPGHCCC